MKIGKIKPQLITAFFVFHFIIIALGMAKVSPHRWPHLERVVFWYSRFTGAGGGFGFFSPDIPKEVMVKFDIENSDGTVDHTTLQELTVREVRFRLGNMIRLMAKSYQNEKLVRSIAASLTARVFYQHPNAKIITMHVFVYDFPNMAEWREGKRPDLKPVYTVQFGRRG